jgi:hypothetical protein
MEYLVNGNKYNLSYVELRDKYNEICSLSLQSFLARLPEVLHLACVISFLKEIPNEHLVGDEAILHNLVHLLDIPDEPLVCAEKIKEQFEEEMKLI